MQVRAVLEFYPWFSELLNVVGIGCLFQEDEKPGYGWLTGVICCLVRCGEGTPEGVWRAVLLH